MQILCNNDDSEGYIFVALGGLNFFLHFLSNSRSYMLQYRHHFIVTEFTLKVDTGFELGYSQSTSLITKRFYFIHED